MSESRFFLCSNCYNAWATHQTGEICPVCGHTLVECEPGAADDSRRKPLMDAQGNLQTHAPRWWLEHDKKTAKDVE